MCPQEFYTLKGYRMREPSGVTEAMEDYLEMIFRAREHGEIRVKELAALLNVTPSSASKMATGMKKQGLVEFERYGSIRLTPRGEELGGYLMRRHRVLQEFFTLLNGTGEQLEQVERIEHFILPKTLENLEKILPLLEKERQ